VYNHVMKKVKYDVWADYLFSVIEPFLPEEYIALELAAGNLNFTNCFSVYLTDIVATDLSADMLKSDKKNLFPKVCCDMIHLPFFMEFDLIYSTFDSINYITNKQNLKKHFKEVKRCLTDNGVYTFDASLERNSLNHVKEGNKKGFYNNYYYSQKSEISPNRQVHKNSFEIYSDNKIVFKEVHRQKIYAFETYFEVIDNAGLFVVECFDAFKYKPGTPNSERVQFIVKKKK
ncbi:MAG: class I SAM-dependent methyltransferase, partial [Ignavibacteriaceae bacterium]|nr:class I SAM-dependent methyltransferase [Ignavibacteriaceae bacterium]